MHRAVPLLLISLTCVGADEPLTLEQADARFRRAYAIARETNDKKIVDRLDLIRDQLKRTLARNDTSGSERLLRDAEKETGIDPGGKTMSDLPIAQISAALQKKLATLDRPFADALKSNDPAKVRQVVDDFAKLLGDQAGVPDARFKGDQLPVIAVKSADVDSAFLKILDSKSPLLQTFMNETPSPNQMARAYGTTVQAMLTFRPGIEKSHPKRLPEIDRIIDASCKAMIALQTPQGFFKFPDLRGKHIRFGAMIEKLYELNSDAVRDGWVVVPAPDGGSQFDAGECGIALLRAGTLLKNDDFRTAGLKAAEWARTCEPVSNFNYNAFSVSLLCEAFRTTKNDGYRQAALQKYQVAVAPGQSATGRWIDGHNARTVYSLILLRSLNDLEEILPDGAPRTEIARSADRLVASIVAEAAKLGSPATTYALGELSRYSARRPKDTSARKLVEQIASAAYQKCTPKGRVRPAVPMTEFAAIRGIWSD